MILATPQNAFFLASFYFLYIIYFTLTHVSLISFFQQAIPCWVSIPAEPKMSRIGFKWIGSVLVSDEGPNLCGENSAFIVSTDGAWRTTGRQQTSRQFRRSIAHRVHTDCGREPTGQVSAPQMRRECSLNVSAPQTLSKLLLHSPRAQLRLEQVSAAEATNTEHGAKRVRPERRTTSFRPCPRHELACFTSMQQQGEVGGGGKNRRFGAMPMHQRALPCYQRSNDC